MSRSRYTYAGRREELVGKRLSRRELQVLWRIAHGWSYDRIATDLGLAYSTVKVFAERTRFKLGARNEAHAVALAIRSCQMKIPHWTGRFDG